MIMNFSQAPREGFYQAIRSSFESTDVHPDCLLKGCYLHWKQSVQRIESNHAIVSPDKAAQFFSLTYKLNRSTVEDIFVETAKTINKEFPNARSWLLCNAILPFVYLEGLGESGNITSN